MQQRTGKHLRNSSKIHAALRQLFFEICRRSVSLEIFQPIKKKKTTPLNRLQNSWLYYKVSQVLWNRTNNKYIDKWLVQHVTVCLYNEKLLYFSTNKDEKWFLKKNI